MSTLSTGFLGAIRGTLTAYPRSVHQPAGFISGEHTPGVSRECLSLRHLEHEYEQARARDWRPERCRGGDRSGAIGQQHDLTPNQVVRCGSVPSVGLGPSGGHSRVFGTLVTWGASPQGRADLQPAMRTPRGGRAMAQRSQAGQVRRMDAFWRARKQRWRRRGKAAEAGRDQHRRTARAPLAVPGIVPAGT
jgi:hypothetical protein